MPVTDNQIIQNDILKATFRANPAYELVLFDRLPEEQRDMLADLCREPGFYGMLRPRTGAPLPLKSVCRDTALLFYSLDTPHELPRYVLDASGDGLAESVRRLVLDGVLEIERSGRFVSGAGAAELFFTARTQAADTALARLSMEALQYAQQARTTDVVQLAAKLYQYNRMPLSPASLRTIDDVQHFLGIQDGGTTAQLLKRHWRRNEQKSDSDGWISWSNRNRDLWFDRMHVTYKLYVSPRPEQLPEVLRRVGPIAGKAKALHMKVGRQPTGVLRSDKFVLYFATEHALHEAANLLQRELAGFTAHGVPFTAELSGDGLLSWGMDPPSEERTLSWLPQQSWRMWVSTRLATALASAKTSPDIHMEPWEYAVERVQLEGVDTETWTPTKCLWPSTAADHSDAELQLTN